MKMVWTLCSDRVCILPELTFCEVLLVEEGSIKAKAQSWLGAEDRSLAIYGVWCGWPTRLAVIILWQQGGQAYCSVMPWTAAQNHLSHNRYQSHVRQITIHTSVFKYPLKTA